MSLRILPSLPFPEFLTRKDLEDIAALLLQEYGCTEYQCITPSFGTAGEQLQGYYNPCKYYEWAIDVQRLNGKDTLCLTSLGRYHSDHEPFAWSTNLAGTLSIGAD